MVNYIGYYDNAQVDWSLENPNCTAEFSNSLLALWAESTSQTSPGVNSNLTALFCETRYDIQEYIISVNASSLAILDGNQTTSNGTGRTAANINSILNTTALEYILATGVNLTDQQTDLPNLDVLDQYTQLMKFKLAWPVSNMVGFAVALNPLTLEDLASPSALQNAFELAHQLVFTTAVSSLLNATDQQQAQTASRPGVLRSSPTAIVLVRPIAIVVEVVLGLIASCTIFLWYYYQHRRYHLKCDPGSIADVMDMVYSGRLLIWGDGHKKVASEDGSFHERHQLLEKPVSKFGTNVAEQSPRLSFCNSTQETIGNKSSSIPHPFELRRLVGMFFIFVILLSIPGLVFLDLRAVKINGMFFPWHSTQADAKF
jgi:hypothetical protein